MRFIRYILPHLVIAMALGLLVMAVLDSFNPTMAFLTSRASKTYIGILCTLALILAGMYIAGSQKQ